MNAAQISSATTAQLVAFYNGHAAKPVTKFADRKTAERRVAALVADMGSVTDFDVHHCTNCPSCGVHLSNGVGAHGDDLNGKPTRHEKFQYVCLGCGEEFGPAIRGRSAKSPTASASIAASWDDPEVRAARAERTAVAVKGPKVAGEYKSVAAAFRALGLPMGKHIRFRMDLKAAGKLSFGDLLFTTI